MKNNNELSRMQPGEEDASDDETNATADNIHQVVMITSTVGEGLFMLAKGCNPVAWVSYIKNNVVLPAVNSLNNRYLTFCAKAGMEGFEIFSSFATSGTPLPYIANKAVEKTKQYVCTKAKAAVDKTVNNLSIKNKHIKTGLKILGRVATDMITDKVGTKVQGVVSTPRARLTHRRDVHRTVVSTDTGSSSQQPATRSISLPPGHSVLISTRFEPAQSASNAQRPTTRSTTPSSSPTAEAGSRPQRPVTRSTTPSTDQGVLVSTSFEPAKSKSSSKRIASENALKNDLHLLQHLMVNRNNLQHTHHPIKRFRGTQSFGQMSLLSRGLISVQETLIVEYQEAIKSAHRDQVNALKTAADTYDKKQKHQYAKFINEKKNIIKLWLGIILIELKLCAEIDQSSNDPTLKNNKSLSKEITDEIDNLFKRCMQKPDLAYSTAIEYFKKISSKHTEISELLDKLKNYFTELNQLIDGTYSATKNTLWEVANGTEVRPEENSESADVYSTFLTFFENQQYSECGKLMRMGKLGEVGFFAGSIIEGIFAGHQLSTKSKFAIKCMVAKFISEVVKNQTKIHGHLHAMEEDRLRLFSDVEERYFKRTNMIIDRYITSTDPQAEENSIKTLERLRIGYDQVLQYGNTVIGRNQLNEIKNMHDTLIESLVTTIKQVCKQNAEEIDGIIGDSTKLVKDLFKTFTCKQSNTSLPNLRKRSTAIDVENDPVEKKHEQNSRFFKHARTDLKKSPHSNHATGPHVSLQSGNQ